MREYERDNEPCFPTIRAVQHGTRACLTSEIETRSGRTRPLGSSRGEGGEAVYKGNDGGKMKRSWGVVVLGLGSCITPKEHEEVKQELEAKRLEMLMREEQAGVLKGAEMLIRWYSAEYRKRREEGLLYYWPR